MTKIQRSDKPPQRGIGTSYGLVTPALLRAARSAYGQAVREALAEAGFDDLPRNGAFVLGAMVDHGVPPAEVIRELGVTKQAASQLIDTLAVRGYLERTTDAADRRRMKLEATERGRTAAKAVRAGVDAIDRELAKRLSPEDLRIFLAGLVALTEIGASKREESMTPLA